MIRYAIDAADYAFFTEFSPCCHFRFDIRSRVDITMPIFIRLYAFVSAMRALKRRCYAAMRYAALRYFVIDAAAAFAAATRYATCRHAAVVYYDTTIYVGQRHGFSVITLLVLLICAPCCRAVALLCALMLP